MVRIFAIVFLAVAMFFTYAIHRSARRQNDAHLRFQPVAAEVLNARVRSASSGSSGSRTTSYFPEIEYRYTVDGRQYTSKKFHFMGRGHSSYDSAKVVVDAYPVGQTVSAYYDPNNPAVAVLDRSPVDVTVLNWVTAGVWTTILGVCVYIFFIESRINRRA